MIRLTTTLNRKIPPEELEAQSPSGIAAVDIKRARYLENLRYYHGQNFSQGLSHTTRKTLANKVIRILRQFGGLSASAKKVPHS